MVYRYFYYFIHQVITDAEQLSYHISGASFPTALIASIAIQRAK